MILSLNLLHKISPKLKKIPLNQLCTALMDLGCEVETINSIKPSTNLVFAKVLEKTRHPNANHLNLVKVKANQKVYEVVCGANNFSVHNWVVLAKLNAELANGLKITPRELRGYVSNGMLCAYSEINPQATSFLTSTDLDGILVLDDNYDHYKTPNQIFNLDDVILDLSIPSNRNDLNGYFWIAKELCAYFDFEYVVDATINHRPHKEIIDVRILSDDVNSYGIIEVKNIQNYILKWNTKSILISNQIKVLNNFADNMNFLTLLTANPLHAFDARKISGQIVVKNAEEDAILLGLDQKEYLIKKGDLIIVDDQKILALAGIIGSNDSKIDATSTTAYIECANFNPMLIANTARRLKINTAAAMRFSKPLTNYVTKVTLKKLLANFKSDAKLIYYFKHSVHNVIKNKINQVSDFVGAEIDLDTAQTFLKRLGYKINKSNLITPSHRYDVLNEFDVYEDIMKKISIQEIKPQPISFDILNFENNLAYDFEKKVSDFLVDQGLFECKTYNLKNQTQAHEFNFFNFKQAYEINNPISNMRSHLKLNNLNSLLEVLEYNQNQKNELENIFEISKINPVDSSQQTVLSIILCKPLINSKINDSLIVNNFVTTKALLHALLTKLNIDYAYDKNHVVNELYDNNQLALINANKQVFGFIGQLKNQVKKTYGLSNDIFIINLNLTSYLNQKQVITKVIKPSMYHDVIRDISVKLASDVDLNNIIANIKKIKNIRKVEISDLYIKDDGIIYTFKYYINDHLSNLSSEQIIIIEQEVNNYLKQF